MARSAYTGGILGIRIRFSGLRIVSFMLRLPSEALPLHRALEDEPLLSSGPPINTAVIGLRELSGQQRLIIKLARRKNASGGYTATRPCFCRDNALLPKQNCTIHIFWADILKTTAPGERLCPALKNKNINRALKAAFRSVGIPEAERYSSHFFRRGDANAILHSGSTLAEILRTVGWKSSSFPVYLDIQRAEESSMRTVLAGEDSPSSDCISSASSSATKTPPAKFRKASILPLLSARTYLLHRYRHSPVPTGFPTAKFTRSKINTRRLVESAPF